MGRYNTFWNRFWAGIIDGLILLPIPLFSAFILTSDQNIGIVLIWLPISYLSIYLYSIYFHWKNGQTIGKKVMNVKVIDVSESKGLTFKQAFLRDCIYIVFQIIGVILIVLNIIKIGSYTEDGIEPYSSYLSYLSFICFLIEIITMFTNNKLRSLHDLMANTVVINTQSN